MFNRNQLKIFFMALMTLDHIDLFVSGETATFFHAITRPVAVFFAYMLVEGFHYTRSKKGYLTRLYLWAGIMYLGNFIINLIVKDPMYQVHNNIFMTLAVGATLLYIIEIIKAKADNTALRIGLTISIIVITFLGSFLTEGGYVVLPFILVTYFTYGKYKVRDLCYIALSAMIFFLFDMAPILDSNNAREFWLNFGYNSDWMFVFVIPFLHLYNGKKGSDKPIFKYLFYIYYPAHLWIIALLANYLQLKK